MSVCVTLASEAGCGARVDSGLCAPDGFRNGHLLAALG